MSRSTSQKPHAIAIVGIGGLFPGSLDVGQFWSHILRGTDLITDIPASHWRPADYYDADPKVPDKTYARRGGFLPEVPFDSLSFGIPPSLLSSTDTSQLLGLLVARSTLEDCFQGRFREADKSRISVLLGVTSGQELFGQMAARLAYPQWRAGMLAAGVDEKTADEAVKHIADSMVPWTESTFPGLLGNVVAGRIANRLDLGGTNAVTDAACASSFAAVSMAMDELTLGRADVVLTGGVDTLNDIFMHMCFSKTPALSAQGDCRPFDESADGTLLGEGLGMVALKRLDDAERDGDQIYAVIRGLGTSSDGRAKSVYAPVPEGQARALARAYEAAGYGPETVELVEAHGTGTKAGDIAELTGLKLAFRATGRPDHQWCALGSVKSQIGHTKAAAGAAGLLKVALALHHKVLPGTLKVDRPNPRAELESSPFYVNARARPWVRTQDHPRRAGVSSFGFGGSNFHITLEEYVGPAEAPRFSSAGVSLFCLSGASRTALCEAVQLLKASALVESTALEMLAADTRAGFRADANERLCFVASSRDELHRRLQDAESLCRGEGARLPGLHLGSGVQGGKVALLFPGQGSQSVEMGAALAMHFPEALAALDEADDISLGDRRLSQVVFPAPAFSEEARTAQRRLLTQTEWAQPALGATSVSYLRVLRDRLGLAAHAYAGHSFGELTALHAAGAFDYGTLLRLARRRGELMAQASTLPGGMVAVTGSIEQVRSTLRDARIVDVVIANHNAPDQVVISGESTSLTRATAQLEQTGLRCRALPVSTAFHSPLVASAASGLREVLDDVTFAELRAPVYSNATASPYPEEPVARAEVLASQLSSEVRFVEEIEAMYAAGMRVFVEVGAGRVLTGLVSRILGQRPHEAIALDGGSTGLSGFFDGVARLCAAGVPLSLELLEGGFRAAASAPSSGNTGVTTAVNGANVGKPPSPPPAPRRPAEFKNAPTAGASQPAASRPHAPRPTAFAEHVMPTKPTLAPVATTAPEGPPSFERTGPLHGEGEAGYLRVFREGQRQTAEAHTAFQARMAEAHEAFLRAFESSTAHLAAMLSGVAIPSSNPGLGVAQPSSPAGVSAAPYGRVGTEALPVLTAAPMATPFQAAPARGGSHDDGAARPHAADAVSLVGSPPALRTAGGARPGAQRSAPLDVEALLLAVVAEKTGYPAGALSPSMSLEADLGIDSIKRVEILGALRERVPSLPELDAMALSQLGTLAEVVDHLRIAGGTEGVKDATRVQKTPLGVHDDLGATLLAVVAEKTGYPAEALSPSMNLEADLGIDSIKRVEILGAMKERVPTLPELDAMQLAQLATLGEVAAALQPKATSGVVPPRMTPEAAASVAAGPDVAEAFLAVVADKTGYPQTALSLSMSLEADLGIDSIKRVEILGAMKERVPTLPELDAMQLAQLSTLDEIVAALSPPRAERQQNPPQSMPLPVAPSSPEAVESAFLAVVAEKTGYPVAALTLEMALEADLGVDSIKRVEILGAMKERLPGLPEVDAMQLAQLSTLGEIVASLRPRPTSSPVSVAQISSAAVPPRVTRAEVVLQAADGGQRLPFELAGVRVLVVPADPALTSAVCDELSDRGAKPEILEGELTRSDFEGVIDLGGCVSVPSDDDALRVLRRSFDVARRAARPLQQAAQRGAFYCTVQDLGGTFGLKGAPGALALLGGLAGLLKTAAAEWNGVRCKALDLDRAQVPAAKVAALVVDEATAGYDAVELGCQGELRWTVKTRPVALAAPREPMVGDAPVVVATGGARGVTATSLEALAERTPGLRLVLLGRTDIEAELRGPECALREEAALKQALLQSAKMAGQRVSLVEIGARAARILAAHEVRDQLDRFKALGAEVLYVPVDVRDAAALEAALQTARDRFGPLTGIVHGAGVLADKRLEDKTLEHFDAVMDTKVRGLIALLAATKRDPLRFIALFSSVAGRFGNTGQADYAMANEALNKMAARERGTRGSSCVVKAYGWGPWEGGMVTPALRKMFESRGVALLSLADGARYFVDELTEASPAGLVEVVFGGELAEKKLSTDGDTAPFSVKLNAQHHAHLRDHSLRGTPVLPAVFALDLMVQAAERRFAGRQVRTVSALRVLRGVPLSRFGNGGNELTVQLREAATTNADGALTVDAEVFLDGQGAPRYRASLELAAALDAPVRVPSMPEGLRPFPHDRAGIYRDLLFHGPSFQLIDSVHGVSEAGIVATVRGVHQSDWSGAAYFVDAGALDAGLQLVLLLARHSKSGAFLPTAVERFVRYRTPFATGPLRCVVHSRGINAQDRVVADVWFVDEEERVSMRMEGVEVHRLLDADAFRRHDGDGSVLAAS